MTQDTHTATAVTALRSAARHVSAQSLPQANRDATELLLNGVLWHPGPDDRDVKTAFVDWSYEALEGSRDEILDRTTISSSTSCGSATRTASLRCWTSSCL